MMIVLLLRAIPQEFPGIELKKLKIYKFQGFSVMAEMEV